MVSPDHERPVEVETFDFSTALDDLKKWQKITRNGWNWKGMYLQLQTPDENSKMSLPYIYINMIHWKTSECWTKNEIEMKNQNLFLKEKIDLNFLL